MESRLGLSADLMGGYEHPLTSADALDQRLRLYLQAAAGLLAAHRAGVIHRDFKPDNVLVVHVSQ